MAIKEIPTNFRVYYKAMHNAIQPKYEKAVEAYEALLIEEKAIYSEVKSFVDIYKDTYKIKLTEYEEFVKNEFITGEFYEVAKSAFLNKKQNYKTVTLLYKLYKLAKMQKELKTSKHQIDIWETMLGFGLEDYKHILEVFYNEVMRQLIVEGKGYVFEQPLGWICINRCKIVQGKRKHLDYKATKAKKQELLDAGKRIYNKDEADYAARLGLEYKGEDYRVFLDKEYVYEFAFINCRVIKEKIDFKVTDSHRITLTGKTDEELIKDCDNDLNKICSLKINPRRKLSMCLQIDDLLYLNFIRNEAQQSVKTPKANRKSGQ